MTYRKFPHQHRASPAWNGWVVGLWVTGILSLVLIVVVR